MTVVDHEPNTWFLLRDGEKYFLDVSCNVSAAGFTVLIKLTPEEYREYHGLGRVYIQYLAARVQYRATEYVPRNLDRELGQRVTESIHAWRGSRQ